MSRPAARELARIAQGRTGVTIVIQSAPALWRVTYQGEPVTGYRTRDNTDERKYFRNTFSGPGHAQRLAHKLNHWFRTEDFAAEQIA